MSEEPSRRERARAVVLAVVTVLSVVGGAAAVAGQSAAGGSLEDATDDVAVGSPAGSDVDETQSGTVPEETGTAASTGDGGERQAEAASSQGASTGSGGDATPTLVNVTAGATNQPPIAVENGGPAELTLEEAEPGSFPDSGTATLRLPADGNVSFDPANTSATASGDGATASVTDVTAREVTVSVSATDGSTNSSIAVEGLRFTTSPGADSVEATWTFGDVSDATTVGPERLDLTGFGDALARGAHRAPDEETGLSIEGGRRTEGLHAADRQIVVSIPKDSRDEIAFDTSASVDVTTRGGDCDDTGPIPPIGGVPGLDFTVNETEIRITPGCEIGHDESVFIQGVRFNVSGAGVSDPAEITAQLETSYEPVDATERVSLAAGSPVDGHAPTVDATATTVEAGATNTTGDGGVTVSITDDDGGLIGDGTRITVEAGDPGVSFDESQALEAVTVSGDATAPTVVSVNATTVVLEAQADSQQGDEFRIQRAGGGDIRFDVGTGAGDAPMYVSTTPGAEDVTQSTGTAVTVTGQDCRSIPHAVAGEDGVVDNADVLTAIDHWENDEKVPGTCGTRMTKADLQEVIDVWEREDSEVGRS